MEEVKDTKKAEENAKAAEPLVMVPLYWLERLIRDSEKYWNTVTDADVLGMMEDLQKSVNALQGQTEVHHDAIVELKRSIEGYPEEDVIPSEKRFPYIFRVLMSLFRDFLTLFSLFLTIFRHQRHPPCL